MKLQNLILSILFTVCAFSLQAQTESEHKKAIRELLQVSGTAEMQISAVEGMIPQLKQLYPSLPDVFYVKFQEEIESGSLIELLVDVYMKYFTLEETQQLIAFYKSEIGQVLLEKQPLIMKESIAVGQQWGGQTAEKIIQEVGVVNGQ